MPDDLADLIARGERAAFHAPPGSGVAALQEAVVVGRSAGRDAEAALAAWLLGVCLSASGRWGSALTVLKPLLLDPAAESTAFVAPERRLVASLGASTSASVFRQLGRHGDAAALDRQAAALAGPSDEARFDAAIGLAADAIGIDDVAEAEARIQEAEALIGQRSDWWRQRVRLDWARAEFALLTGLPADAALRASSALSRAEAAGAPRHVAKSLLFLGVALVDAGDFNEALATLRRCVTLAEPLGVLPVLWPARALIGALSMESDPPAAATALAEAGAILSTLTEDLPKDLRVAWLARSDVSALLGGV